MGSISHHITPLVINCLGGGHTHTHKFTDKAILRKQAHAWFNNSKNYRNHWNISQLYPCILVDYLSYYLILVLSFALDLEDNTLMLGYNSYIYLAMLLLL